MAEQRERKEKTLRVVTIDGPAGSGKSTVASKIANKLGFVHLNSGALYRIVGMEAQKKGLDLSDDNVVSKLAQQLDFHFELDAARETVLLVDGRPVGEEVRSEEAGALASAVGLLPQVRNCLTAVQRQIAKQGTGVVLEGRDAGTIVFPDARLKFYLDADVSLRARRRFEQLRSTQGNELQIEDITRALQERDVRDSTRILAPQIQAHDAERIDTSKLTADEVVEIIVAKVRSTLSDC